MFILEALANGDVVVTFMPTLSADITAAPPDDVLAAELKANAVAASVSYLVTGKFLHTEMLQKVNVDGTHITLDTSMPLQQSLLVFEQFFGACESGIIICNVFEACVIGLGGQGQLTDPDTMSLLGLSALRDCSSISSEQIWPQVQLPAMVLQTFRGLTNNGSSAVPFQFQYSSSSSCRSSSSPVPVAAAVPGQLQFQFQSDSNLVPIQFCAGSVRGNSPRIYLGSSRTSFQSSLVLQQLVQQWQLKMRWCLKLQME